MKKILIHKSGVEKEVKIGFSWTTLFFGCIPSILRGDFVSALKIFLLDIFTFRLYSIFKSISINKDYENFLLIKGYEEVGTTNENNQRIITNWHYIIVILFAIIIINIFIIYQVTTVNDSYNTQNDILSNEQLNTNNSSNTETNNDNTAENDNDNTNQTSTKYTINDYKNQINQLELLSQTQLGKNFGKLSIEYYTETPNANVTKEFFEISKKIGQIAPELICFYGATGNTYLLENDNSNSGGIPDMIEMIKKIAKEQYGVSI